MKNNTGMPAPQQPPPQPSKAMDSGDDDDGGGDAREAAAPRFDWDRETWEFVRAYVGTKAHLIAHHQDTYNRFARTNVPAIIARSNPVNMHFDYDTGLGRWRRCLSITFERPGFVDPSVRSAAGCRRTITPSEARAHKYTYASDLVVDVRIKTTVVHQRRHEDDVEASERLPPRVDTNETVVRGYSLGKVPVMLNSCLCVTRGADPRSVGECSKDPGGYFIVNGTEKVLVTTERPADNNIMVYPNARPPAADIKSIPSGKCVRPRPFQIKIVRGPLGDDVVRVFIPQVRQNIPIWTVMTALGGGDDRRIMATLLAGLQPEQVRIQAEQLLRSSIRESAVRSADEAVEFIARHVSSFGGESQVLTRLTGELQAAHARTRAATRGSTAARAAETERARIDERKRISYTRVILDREVLPHVGPSAEKKRLFIGKIFRELVYAVFTRAADDDRDSFANKRLNPTGALMTQLFSQVYTKLLRDVKAAVNKTFAKGAWRAGGNFHNILHADNLYRHVRPAILTKALRTALSTGNLGAKGSTNLVGVSQVLGRLSYNGTLSHLRRVLAPLGNASGKLLKPRALHPTQIMALCPAETPEGQPVGLVKNLALAARVTVYRSPEPAKAFLRRFGVREIAAADDGAADDVVAMARQAHVYVDGEWWGTCDDPAALLRALRAARLRGDLHPHTSVLWNRSQRARCTGARLGEVRVCGTGGRLVRPLYRLRPGGAFVATAAHTRFLREGGTFDALLRPALAGSRPCHLPPPVEFLDIAETGGAMIAMTAAGVRKHRPGVTIRHTHCELHPALMFGVLAGVIPFSDHNQSPRNTYQSAMGKQAMGIPTTNFQDRFATLSHLLLYPQRPMVQSRVQSFLPTLESGQNIIVAIGVNGGYNQEDSLILNQASVERGMMVSTMLKTYRNQEQTAEGTSHSDVFCVPSEGVAAGNELVGTKVGGYDKLGPDGLARVGSVVKNGDVIIGKITPVAAKGSRCRAVDTYRDSSTVLRNCTGGIIDKTEIVDLEDGGRIARVRVRSPREASIGDKFSSRHGQKGTCGMLRRQGDMPFTASGITPDIIMNPHAIPSRMTVGQLVEMFITKICARIGARGDATPFTGMRPETILGFIEAIGTSPGPGDEVLFDPVTGRRQECVIFMCPTHYQKLRHIARDKTHGRSTGPMVELTRQPTEGRIREGGLRVGEMERDCLLGHGMAGFTRESFVHRSDDFRTGVCNRCGAFAPHNAPRGIVRCYACTRQLRARDGGGDGDGDDPDSGGTWTDVSRVELPYTAKLFSHEMTAMQMRVALRTSSTEPSDG